MMEAKIMTLDKAKLNVAFPEFALVLLWQSWICYTDIKAGIMDAWGGK